VPQESETTAKLTNAIIMSGSDTMNLQNGWEIKRLEDCFKLKSGDALTSKMMVEEGGFPVFGGNGIAGYHNEFNVSGNNVIIGRVGALCGNARNTTEKIWLTDNAFKIVEHNYDFDNSFLTYLLNFKNLRSFARQAAQPVISNSSLKDVVLEFPKSLPEQQRIVSILDKTFAAIDKAKANLQQNLQNAKELFESYLQNVFAEKGEGWEEKRLSELGITQTGTTPKTSEKEYYGDFIPFIKPADVDFNGVGDLRYNNEGLSEIGLKKGRKMDKGSILMVCIGATIGKVGFSEMTVSCNQQINSLTLKKEFEPKFFYYAMTTMDFQEKVISEGKGSQATLPIINKSKWENLTISFPISKKEQQEIVAKLDALQVESSRLQIIYQQKLSSLEELKKSILQKAFSGELTAAPKLYATDEAALSIAAEPEAVYKTKQKVK
jgi:type I restriction enzyme, S subunit